MMSSPMFDLLIRNAQLVEADKAPYAGSVAINGESIAALLPSDTQLEAKTVIDADGLTLLPGVIDPHTHIRYNTGYGDDKEQYATETRSALIGGVTSAFRMHRELIPYDESIPAEIEVLEARSHIDMGFHLAAQTEEQLKSLPDAAEKYGIRSFKLYLAYKGQSGKLQGLQGADDGYLYAAFKTIHEIGGIACLHCENTEITERMAQDYKAQGRTDLRVWSESRPGWTEAEAIFRAGYIAHQVGCPLYIVHVSSAEGMAAIERLRDMGAEIYAEVCIHHLSHTVDDMAEFGSLAKVNPPLRFERDVEALWDGIQRGVVDTIGTDHVPHIKQKVRDSIWNVMPGFAGIATMLPALLTLGYHQRGIVLSRLMELTSRNAARLFKLETKCALRIGGDADFTLVDLNESRSVDANQLGSVADYSLFEGQMLRGWAHIVISRGRIAMRDGEVVSAPGDGCYLRR